MKPTRCQRCYGTGQIAVVPDDDSPFRGQAYEIQTCPTCKGTKARDAGAERKPPPPVFVRRKKEAALLWRAE